MPYEKKITGRILGVDYGAKRVGVAISDPLGVLAHPLMTIQTRSEEEKVSRLVQVIDQYDVRTVVVGMPMTLRGEEGGQAEIVRRFIRMLSERVNVPIRPWDERLTTESAHRQLRGVGRKPSRSRALVDQVAAVEILQSYLDWLGERTRSSASDEASG